VKRREGTGRKLNPLEQSRRNPKSRVLAIRAKCWDCEGRDADPGWKERVRECVVHDCPLRPFRPYQGRGTRRGEIGLQKPREGGFSEQGIDSGSGART